MKQNLFKKITELVKRNGKEFMTKLIQENEQKLAEKRK
jgi:hypothetical protein